MVASGGGAAGGGGAAAEEKEEEKKEEKEESEESDDDMGFGLFDWETKTPPTGLYRHYVAGSIMACCNNIEVMNELILT